MKKLPISVFIIACDEQERIALAINSVISWVDEVIVIDSGSIDETLKIANNLGARTVFNEWRGYGQQKIHGESLCKNKWLLNIDADEEISPQLAQEIQLLFANGEPSKSAFIINWKLLLRIKDTKPPLFAPGSSVIRLYNKEKAGFRDSTIHDSVIVLDGEIGNLKGIIHHRCFKNLQHWTGKINSYSSMQALDMVAKNRKISPIRILLEPLVAFLKAYFIRRYFLYGIDGFIGSIQYSYARLLRLAKTRELYRDNKALSKK